MYLATHTSKGYVTYGRIITLLTVFGVSLQVANFWHLGHGRTVYPLMLTIYTTFAVLELTLALRTKAQLSLILCVGIDLWAIAMAVYGMWRLE